MQNRTALKGKYEPVNDDVNVSWMHERPQRKGFLQLDVVVDEIHAEQAPGGQLYHTEPANLVRITPTMQKNCAKKNSDDEKIIH